MLFYMQMKNWFLVFLLLTIAYLIQQKSSATNTYKIAARFPTSSFSVVR